MFPLCCDVKELSPTGAGYPMFYAFMRNVNIMMAVLSILVSLPCMAMAWAQFNRTDDSYSDYVDNADWSNPKSMGDFNTTAAGMVLKLSVGTVFRNPYNATPNILWTTNKASNLFRSDIVVYLNIIGVIYVLLHSIYLRRMLVGMSIELDKKDVSPSDYGIVVRNLPKDITKETLIRQIEEKFAYC